MNTGTIGLAANEREYAESLCSPSAAHTRIPEAMPSDEAPPGNLRSGVAQLVEQPPVKRPVVGSSPTPGAIDEFIVRAERHAYRWTEMNRPLPLV